MSDWLEKIEDIDSRISELQTERNKLVEKLRTSMLDKSIPLDERFDIFCKTFDETQPPNDWWPDAVHKLQDAMDIEYSRRGQTVDIFSEFESCFYPDTYGIELTDEEKKLVDELKEDMIKDNYTEYILDW